MELQFHKNSCRYLKKTASQVQTQEQTQEIRLTDAMPDIGRVLGCWGQIVLRGKEWHSDAMAVSGGVLVWAMYVPEDGTEPRIVDAWIPFQMKWDVPVAERDGTVVAWPELKSMDVRSTSARKMMVRTVVSVLGEALEPAEAEIFAPPQIPEDVELLRNTYPAELAQEAGEKAFRLDEQLSMEAAVPAIAKIIRSAIRPVVTENRVMGSRLVFRGTGELSILYMGADGGIYSYSWEVPFSQYTDLGNDYSSNATASILPVVTGLETEPSEDKGIYLKCGITCQYVIFDRTMLDVVEDAYSTSRSVIPKYGQLVLPMLLERRQEPVRIYRQTQIPGSKALDVTWYKGHPKQVAGTDVCNMELAGQFQMLYLDEEGTMQGTAVRSETSWELPSDDENRVDCFFQENSNADASFTSEGAELTANGYAEMLTYGARGIPMVMGIEMGEAIQPDPGRPSLILRRAGSGSLWEIAKSTGSTVDAIRKANGIQGEPDGDQILLIPVS